MRYLIALFFMISSLWVSAQSIYGNTITLIDGSSVSMDDFKGRKVLIAAVNIYDLAKTQLYYLDSLQLSHPGLTVIACPAKDYGDVQYADSLSYVDDKTSGNVLISKGIFVKKASGAMQDSVFKWLTDKTKNGHFNSDVSTDDQLFIISESGVLYAVLEKGVPPDVLDSVIDQADVQ